MPGNGKVFISHTNDAHEQCEAIHRYLTERGIDCWYDARDMAPGQVLTQEMQRAIEARDIFLRVCTPGANTSYYMQLERDMLIALQAIEYQTARQRLAIALCFPGYRVEPLDRVVKYIDAGSADQPQAAWLDELRCALELPMGAVVFDRDDRDYLWWIRTYPHGWTIKTERKAPRTTTIMLHHADCDHIGDGYADGALVAKRFIRICAVEPQELRTWVARNVASDAAFVSCGSCLYKMDNPLA